MAVFVAALLELYRPRLPSGQGLVEYALIIVLIAVVTALTLAPVGGTIGGAVGDIAGVVSAGNNDITGLAGASDDGAAPGVQPAGQHGGRPRHGQGWLKHFGVGGPPGKP